MCKVNQNVENNVLTLDGDFSNHPGEINVRTERCSGRKIHPYERRERKRDTTGDELLLDATEYRNRSKIILNHGNNLVTAWRRK